MNIRLLRTTLFIAGLCLLTTNASTPQTRRSAPRLPRVSSPRVIPGLSPESRASIAQKEAVNVPWIDSLESGVEAWTTTGFWHLSFQPDHIEVLNPAINPTLVTLPDSGFLPSAYSGNNAFWYGEDVTGTFIGRDYAQVTQSPLDGGTSSQANTGSAITPPINLVGQKTPLLSFWTWWEIEGIATSAFDIMYVEASDDSGLTWNPLGRGLINPLDDDANQAHSKSYSSGGLGKQGKWIREYFDLTSYVGKVILIRFRFDTGDEKYNGFRGWLIDDIGVSAAGAGAPTIAQVAPATVNTSQLVGVIGTNMVSGAVIQVDSTASTELGVISTTFAQFYVPSGISNGTHSLQITNPDGKFVVKLNAFTVTSNAPPVLFSVTPDSAPVGVSAPMTLSGSNFAAGATVDIGGVPASLVQVVGPTQITAVSPNKLAVGVYNVTVLNPDGLSDVSILGFKVFTPGVSVAATGDSLIGNAQPLTITPPAGKTFTGGKIFFRSGGSNPYDSLALTGSGPFAVNLPAKVITIRGVEYYISLISGVTGGSITYPTNNPALNPATLPVRLAKLATPVNLSPLKYKMFSSPMLLDDPNVMIQLRDDYGAYNPARWRVFHWETGAYREAVLSASTAGPMVMVPGRAFWLVTSDGSPFTFKHGTSVPTVQSYSVPLDTGWNQIANPFAFNVAWSTVGGGGQVDGPYYYDGSQYKLITTVVKPYEGYFVYNPFFSETSLLTFYPVESNLAALHKDGFESTSLGPGEFVMQISAAIPGTDLRDTYNYVGLCNGASAGRDVLDAPKPPAIGDAVQVEIIDGGTAYLQNFKPPAGEGQSWIFDLRTLGTKGNAVLTLSSSGTLPAGYSVHVLDLKNENALPAASGSFQVGLDAPNAPHYYKVIMGTDEYAAKESNSIPLQPVSYALGQNYPNPFNPTTTIRYSLAKRSDVALEIYNTLGQRVRTLLSGSQTTGEYAITWDGTNDNGAHVASGIYFYRLRTEEFNAVRKLAMIR
jgi:hypothetical protein